jgi:hypothetical protein
VVSFIPLSLYLRGKSPQYPSDRRPPQPVWTTWRKFLTLAPAAVKHRAMDPVHTLTFLSIFPNLVATLLLITFYEIESWL